MIDLFETKDDPDQNDAMSVLWLALSVLRFGSIVLYRDGCKRHDVIAKPQPPWSMDARRGLRLVPGYPRSPPGPQTV